MEIRVYYEDTDAGGVVYYANYLRWFERARTEWLRTRGLDPAALQAQDLCFTVTRCDTRYRRPARYGDLVRLETEVAELGRASLDLWQRVFDASGGLLVEARVSLACVRGGTLRPCALPEALRGGTA